MCLHTYISYLKILHKKCKLESLKAMFGLSIVIYSYDNIRNVILLKTQ